MQISLVWSRPNVRGLGRVFRLFRGLVHWDGTRLICIGFTPDRFQTSAPPPCTEYLSQSLFSPMHSSILSRFFSHAKSIPHAQKKSPLPPLPQSLFSPMHQHSLDRMIPENRLKVVCSSFKSTVVCLRFVAISSSGTIPRRIPISSRCGRNWVGWRSTRCSPRSSSERSVNTQSIDGTSNWASCATRLPRA